ncbi:4'-phosphopantetheinyl transferase superfamily protein [Streptomyces sp. f51]|uniref:4'-phosphopantetheinyl transferase superfamily protein n=1 Tax=Streptomyces sp. f51 TaxID=1827742 RepID=UPI0030D1A51E
MVSDSGAPYDPTPPQDRVPPYDPTPLYDRQAPYDRRVPQGRVPPYDPTLPYDRTPPYEQRAPQEGLLPQDRPAASARPVPQDRAPAYSLPAPHDLPAPQDRIPAYDVPGGPSGRVPVLPSFPAPCHVAGPDGPWEEVQERVEESGRAVVHTTWGQWLTPALLDPGLRTLLGRDWPRYRQHPAPAGRLILAVSRTVLKHTAAAALQVPAGRLDLAVLPGGRPVLRGLGADLQVSLTHTDELIAVGVSRTGPIGVDAEPAARRISFEALSEHVCTAGEARLLAALPEEERTGAFLRLWTLKEAYAKALGHGMRRRFSAIGFEWNATGTPRLADDTAGEWAFATHLVDERYLVSEAYHPARRGPGPR